MSEVSRSIVLRPGGKIKTKGPTTLTFSVSPDGREGTVAVAVTGVTNSDKLRENHEGPDASANFKLASVIVTVGGSNLT